MKACIEVEFPICLNNSLFKMLGVKGKKKLDSMVMNETFENTQISSPKDIWNLYEKYIERLANILGDEIAQIIELEDMNQMKSMICTRCPLYERELERRKITEKS